MSRTQVKNGSRVEVAAKRLALAGEGAYWLHVNIAQVAKEAGVSKPTAQKYMNILCEYKVFKEVERDMRYCVKNTPRTYRLIQTLNA